MTALIIPLLRNFQNIQHLNIFHGCPISGNRHHGPRNHSHELGALLRGIAYLWHFGSEYGQFINGSRSQLAQ